MAMTITRKFGKTMMKYVPPPEDRYSGRFARRLRELRIKAGLSQEDVAKAVGVALATYYQWESGKRQVALNYLPPLSKVLKIQIKDLLPEEE